MNLPTLTKTIKIHDNQLIQTTTKYTTLDTEEQERHNTVQNIE